MGSEMCIRDRPDEVDVYYFSPQKCFAADGGPWLAAVLAHLDAQRQLLSALVAEHLPGVVYPPPAATYLAWLDCRALGWGDDPSVQFRARGVRLSEGPNFGAEGNGFARLNFATSGDVLCETVARMAGGH